MEDSKEFSNSSDEEENKIGAGNYKTAYAMPQNIELTKSKLIMDPGLQDSGSQSMPSTDIVSASTVQRKTLTSVQEQSDGSKVKLNVDVELDPEVMMSRIQKIKTEQKSEIEVETVER